MQNNKFFSTVLLVWEKIYAEMVVLDIRKLKAMQEENQRLKRLVADQALKIALLRRSVSHDFSFVPMTAERFHAVA